MGMGISSGYSGMEGKPSAQSKIEAKYPALLFKQHLTACVEKLYGMIRDSLKKEISPFLNSCIQVKLLLLLLFLLLLMLLLLKLHINHQIH